MEVYRERPGLNQAENHFLYLINNGYGDLIKGELSGSVFKSVSVDPFLTERHLNALSENVSLAIPKALQDLKIAFK